MKSILQEKYEKEVFPFLSKELNRKNINSIPKLEKVSVNIGIGSHVTSGNKDYSAIEKNLSDLTGQKPSVKKARMSVSNFKLREGMPVGLTVTLRGKRMYDFIQKLVNIALPRVRDFRGIGVSAFDGKGNYSLGIKEANIFPEVNSENLVKIHGIQINIKTSGRNSYETYTLLKALGFPFKDEVKAPLTSKK